MDAGDAIPGLLVEQDAAIATVQSSGGPWGTGPSSSHQRWLRERWLESLESAGRDRDAALDAPFAHVSLSGSDVFYLASVAIRRLDHLDVLLEEKLGDVLDGIEPRIDLDGPRRLEPDRMVMRRLSVPLSPAESKRYDELTAKENRLLAMLFGKGWMDLLPTTKTPADGD